MSFRLSLCCVLFVSLAVFCASSSNEHGNVMEATPLRRPTRFHRPAKKNQEPQKQENQKKQSPEKDSEDQPEDPAAVKRFGEFTKAISTGVWFVDFHVPWCAHCKKLMPVFEETAALVTPHVNFAKIDCTDNQKICNQYHVSGFPTVVLFMGGKRIEDFHGKRTSEGIVAFLKSHVDIRVDFYVEAPPDVQEQALLSKSRTVSLRSFDIAALSTLTIADDSTLPTFLLFEHPGCKRCDQVRLVLDMLAEQVDLISPDTAVFGTVDCGDADSSERKTCSSVGVRGFPSLILFLSGEGFKYQGGWQAGQFLEFLQNRKALPLKLNIELDHIAPVDMTINPHESPKIQDSSVLPQASHATILTDLSFREETLSGTWFVAFVAGWSPNSRRILPLWDSFAHRISDASPAINVALVDCSQSSLLCKKKRVFSFPKIVTYSNGTHMKEIAAEENAWLAAFDQLSPAVTTPRSHDHPRDEL